MLKLQRTVFLLTGAVILVSRASTQHPVMAAATAEIHLKDASSFYVDFDKKLPDGAGGCHVSQRLGEGDMLHCHIDAPAGAVGVIDSIEYECEPESGRNKPAPCGHIYICPDHGKCGGGHLYAYEPHDLNISKTRSVDWYAWTNDGNSTLIRFTVYMRPS